MTNHIDTLTEWWENAERGAYGYGDTVIQNHHTAPDEYTVYVADEAVRDSGPYVRILHRAPAPKPAWHDAVAVSAMYRDDRGMVSGVWIPASTPGHWEGPEGDFVPSEALEDVTPLIEAKVTDEMVERAREWMPIHTGQTHTRNAIHGLLTAALGIDPA